MASDSREGASSSQDTAVLTTKRPAPFSETTDVLLFSEEVCERCGVDEKTLSEWVKCGLKRPSRKKLRMKRQPYLWGLVVAFMRENLE